MSASTKLRSRNCNYPRLKKILGKTPIFSLRTLNISFASEIYPFSARTTPSTMRACTLVGSAFKMSLIFCPITIIFSNQKIMFSKIEFQKQSVQKEEKQHEQALVIRCPQVHDPPCFHCYLLTTMNPDRSHGSISPQR